MKTQRIHQNWDQLGFLSLGVEGGGLLLAEKSFQILFLHELSNPASLIN